MVPVRNSAKAFSFVPLPRLYLVFLICFQLADCSSGFSFNGWQRRKRCITPTTDGITKKSWFSKKHEDSYITRLSSTDNDLVEREKEVSESERALGILVLLTVPLAWGTYTPVVRYLYEIRPPVPGFVFSASYYWVAALTTSAMVAIQQQSSKESTYENSTESSSSQTFPLLGGLELGSYLFIGNCLQVIGLKSVSAGRAGFLVQLTTIMVPIVEAIFAGNFSAVPVRTWFSCLLAFSGICVMNLNVQDATSVLSLLDNFTKDDLLIIAAAVLYTLHVVRLGAYAKNTTPLKLASAKATVEAFLSTSLVLGLMLFSQLVPATGEDNLLTFAQQTGQEITTFFSSIQEGIASGDVAQSSLRSALGATLWTGWVTCAYTIWSQSFGQARVSPTNSNLIYSLQPIFTATFGFFLLGETMGPEGILGGILIGVAVYLVATGSSTTVEDRVEKPANSATVFDSPVDTASINNDPKLRLVSKSVAAKEEIETTSRIKI